MKWTIRIIGAALLLGTALGHGSGGYGFRHVAGGERRNGEAILKLLPWLKGDLGDE